MEASLIVKRLEILKSSRTIIESTWDLIERYIAVYRGGFFRDMSNEADVDWRRPWIYDSTAVMSSQNLASSLHNGLTSAIARWFTFRFRTGKMNSNVEAMRWLEECTERVWAELQESNFSSEINEDYLDLVNFGTSVLVEEEVADDGEYDGVVFRSIPIKYAYFEVDKDNAAMVFYRCVMWSIGQMVDKWGLEALPQFCREKFESTAYNPDEKFELVFCVYRRDGIWKRNKVWAKTVAPLQRPYGCKWVFTQTKEQIGEEGGYHEMPASVGRWRKTNDSIWGNSPAMIALSDTMTLNRLIELGLAATEKAIDPPTLTTQRGLIGDLDLNAGGLTMVRDIKELFPMESKARFDVQQKEIERLQGNIKDCFFINQLVLPPMGSTPATATEITVRVAQLERLMGTTITRIAKEKLDPVVMRTFLIMYRRGRLPEMPAVVKESGAMLDIQYMGAMFKTQEASGVQNIERWVGFAGQLAQVKPDVLDVVDWNEMMRTVARMLGVPATLQVPQDEVDEVQAQRQQEEQAMQQGMIAEQQAKAAKTGAQADTEMMMQDEAGEMAGAM